MCGIIAAFNTDAAKNKKEKEFVNEWVISQFEDQKNRGTQGFGIVAIEEDSTYKIFRATEGYKFMYDIHENPVYKMLMHHRIPTSTENKMKQTHPILVSNKRLAHDYLVVHNGVIRNSEELREEHMKHGFIYTTDVDEGSVRMKFNDSESLAIEIALYIENHKKELDTEGSAAFIALQIEKKTQKVETLYFGRNDGSPLNLAKTRGSLRISSEGPGDEVTPNTLYFCKLDNEMSLSKRALHFKIVKREYAAYTPPYSYHSTHHTSLGFDTRTKEEKEEDDKYWKGQSKKTEERERANRKLWEEDDKEYIYSSQEDFERNFDEGLEVQEVENKVEETKENVEELIDEFLTELSYCDYDKIDTMEYSTRFIDELEKLKNIIKPEILKEALRRENRKLPVIVEPLT